jgi:hypothetical protein
VALVSGLALQHEPYARPGDRDLAAAEHDAALLAAVACGAARGMCLPLGPCPGLASGGFGRRIDPVPGLYNFSASELR